MGMIYRCVPEADFGEIVESLARRLADGAPVALQLTKRLLNSGSNSTLEEALRLEQTAQVVNLATADAAEARDAFVAQREPFFTGIWLGGGTGTPQRSRTRAE
jgi:2-(1,2-epoxy-1,2-dihydrophenyl)acetyl-CoA isomerase